MRTPLRADKFAVATLARAWADRGNPRSGERGYRRSSGRRSRAGVATLWVILMLPVVFLMLVFVAEIGNLWLARVELENALESAALAAVKEWADDAGASGTTVPRQVGQSFALANRVRGVPVTIGNNFAAATVADPNENASYTFPTANLVFGGISSTAPTVIFDVTSLPACASGPPLDLIPLFGTLLLDATGVSPMSADNAWGLNFKPSDPTAPAGLTISQVVLNLRAGGDTDAEFQPLTTAPVISDNSPRIISSQNDVFGLSNAALTLTTAGTVRTWANSQVRFVWNSTLPYILTIRFLPFGGDAGFEPNDRIRFGARIRRLGGNDGDDPGRSRVTATVTFAIAGVDQAPPDVGTFADSRFAKNNPIPLDPDLTPNSAPYLLPNALSTKTSDDKQSYAVVYGGGTLTVGGGGGGTVAGNEYAVLAQGRVNVTPICGGLMGGILGIFQVQAKTTAYFSCVDLCPRIVRVDQFIYP